MSHVPSTFSPAAEWLRRVIALGSAALVLALTVFAASPAAHQWLHAKQDAACKAHAHPAPAPAETDQCAVVLFAGGVSLPLAPIVAPAPRALAQSLAPTIAREVFLLSPRYLRQPERGPPSERIS